MKQLTEAQLRSLLERAYDSGFNVAVEHQCKQRIETFSTFQPASVESLIQTKRYLAIDHLTGVY